MKKISKAIIGIAVVLVALAAAIPAAAAAEAPAQVRVTNRGDLLVRVQSDHLTIQINSNGVDGYAVWITDSDGKLHVYNVFGVTRHARLDYQNHDYVRVEFGKLAPSSVPADLRISGDQPRDIDAQFHGYDLAIGDDVIVKGDVNFALNDGTIADDLLVYPANGPASVDVRGTTVADRFYIRRSTSAWLDLNLSLSSVGSFSVSGTPGDDHVSLFQANLGPSPRVLLQGGDDHLAIDDATWTNAFKYRGADGDDTLRLADHQPGGFYDVAMQDGDDLIVMQPDLFPFTPDSVFDGGAGEDYFDDAGLRSAAATIKKFELFE